MNLSFLIDGKVGEQMTGKERSEFKARANRLQALSTIGHEGLSAAFIEDLSQLLFHHELVKINVLDTCVIPMNELIQELLEQTGAAFIQQIGRKITIYKESNKSSKVKDDHVRMNKRGGKISTPNQQKMRKIKHQKMLEQKNQKKRSTTRGRRHE